MKLDVDPPEDWREHTSFYKSRTDDTLAASYVHDESHEWFVDVHELQDEGRLEVELRHGNPASGVWEQESLEVTTYEAAAEAAHELMENEP